VLVYLFEEISDEGCFSGWVLTHQQHHRFRVEVWIVKWRRVKIVESVELFERQHLLLVQLLQSVRHRRKRFRFAFAIRVLAEPREHRCAAVDRQRMAAEKSHETKNSSKRSRWDVERTEVGCVGSQAERQRLARNESLTDSNRVYQHTSTPTSVAGCCLMFRKTINK